MPVAIIEELAKLPPEIVALIEQLIVAILNAPSPSAAARAAQESVQIAALDEAMGKVPPIK